MDELKPCPFCGGKAQMVMRGTSLGIDVEHKDGCQIHAHNWFGCGHMAFDTESEIGNIALNRIKKDSAKWWNRRADK